MANKGKHSSSSLAYADHSQGSILGRNTHPITRQAQPISQVQYYADNAPYKTNRSLAVWHTPNTLKGQKIKKDHAVYNKTGATYILGSILWGQSSIQDKSQPSSLA